MSHRYRPRSGYSDFGSLPASAKQRLENQIVRRRENEARHSETWRSNDKYFHHWSVQNEKFTEWTSPRSAQISFRHEREAERQAFVEERRAKLKELYSSDKHKYEEETRRLKEEEEKKKWETMKTKVEQFNKAKEADWKKMAEDDIQKQWRLNSPAFREFQTKLKQEQLKNFWDVQRHEKEEHLRQEKEKLKKQFEEEERQKARLEEEERRAKAADKEKQEQIKADLDKQIEALKLRERDAAASERDYEKLYSVEADLERLNTELEKRDKAQQQRKLSEFLVKQHQAKLRQRSREVAADLEWEQSVAGQVEALGNNKAKVKEDLNRFYQLLEQHKKLEKERAQQMEMLFQEEARLMWEKREEEWEKEKQARKTLLAQVINAQKQQIQEKMELARRERESLLQEQKEIQEQLKTHRRELQRREEESLMKKMTTRQELIKQMEEKKRILEHQIEVEKQLSQRRTNEDVERERKHWEVEMERLKL